MARLIRVFQCITLMVTCTVVTESLLDRIFPEDDQEPVEYVTVELKQQSQSGRSQRDVASCLSEEMYFGTRMKGQEITLDLHSNDDITPNMPVYITGEDGRIIPITIPHLKALRWYQDRNNSAAIGVTYERALNGGCQYELEGTFAMSSGMYLIQPMGNPAGKNYSVRMVNTTEDFHGDYIVTSNNVLNYRSRRDYGKLRRSERQTTRQLYTIEVLVVVDSLVYDFWYNRSRASTERQRSMLALESVQRYYAYLVNSVDLRYRSISEHDMQFRVHYSGLYVSMTANDSPWTVGTLRSTSRPAVRPVVNAYTSLSRFRSWVLSRRFRLPRHDHAMLFTKANIKGRSESTVGIAYLSTACTTRSVSLNEDRFNYATAATAAHELGHSLGSKHDNATEGCNPSNRFIMASSLGPSFRYPQNPWRFSNCSVGSFRAYLRRLNWFRYNCLLNRGNNNSAILDRFISEMPGQFYDIDTQCKNSFGLKWYPSRNRYSPSSYSRICNVVSCSSPDSPSSRRYIFPARGTSCGDRKWCIDGLCVGDNRAPSVPDSCPWGDSPGNFGRPLTCHGVAANKNLCGIGQYRRACCNTCSASPVSTTRRTTLPSQPATTTTSRGPIIGCEYGDRHPGCRKYRCGSYSAGDLNRCCESCSHMITSPPTRRPFSPTPECPAGDRSESCSRMKTYQCYTNGRYCCATCYQRKDVSKPGCEFGDRTGGCRAENCQSYNEATLKTCCATCAHLANRTATTTTTRPTTTTTRPTTTTTRPTTTTTRPTTTTTRPTTTTTRPTTTSTRPTTTTTRPTTTTTRPTTTTTRPTTTSTRPTTTTTRPTTTTTRPTTTTTRPTTTSTRPTTTTTRPTTTTTRPTTTTTRPTTTTTRPTTTSTRPTTTTTRPSSQTTTTTPRAASYCYINNAYYFHRAAHPTSACHICNISLSRTRWSVKASGVCNIGKKCYPDGTRNPTNGCQYCNAVTNTSVWSMRQVRTRNGKLVGCEKICRFYEALGSLYLTFFCNHPQFAIPSAVDIICAVEDINVIERYECDLRAETVRRLRLLCTHRPNPSQLPTSPVCLV